MAGAVIPAWRTPNPVWVVRRVRGRSAAGPCVCAAVLICCARVAELNIHLQIDPETGKKNLIIEYDADPDMLPLEHEDEHRRLVNEIVEGGLVKAEELGKVIVKRDGTVVQVEAEDEQADERESIEQKS